MFGKVSLCVEGEEEKKKKGRKVDILWCVVFYIIEEERIYYIERRIRWGEVKKYLFYWNLKKSVRIIFFYFIGLGFWEILLMGIILYNVKYL